jgi:hypothetical protein
MAERHLTTPSLFLLPLPLLDRPRLRFVYLLDLIDLDLTTGAGFHRSRKGKIRRWGFAGEDLGSIAYSGDVSFLRFCYCYVLFFSVLVWMWFVNVEVCVRVLTAHFIAFSLLVQSLITDFCYKEEDGSGLEIKKVRFYTYRVFVSSFVRQISR